MSPRTLLVFTLSTFHYVYYYYCLFMSPSLTSHYLLSSETAHIAKSWNHTRLRLEKETSRSFFQLPLPLSPSISQMGKMDTQGTDLHYIVQLLNCRARNRSQVFWTTGHCLFFTFQDKSIILLRHFQEYTACACEHLGCCQANSTA